jgi:ATP phosphoribosyltransferase
MRRAMDKITKQKDSIIIGIASKGRIKEHTLGFLKSKNYHIPEQLGRQLHSHFRDLPKHKVVFFHARDIPRFIENDFIDIGFTGLDLIYEVKAKVRPVVRLACSKVKMVIAVRKESTYNHPFHLMHRTISTPFPNIAQEYFSNLKIPIQIHSVQGASEIMPYLGPTEAIMDVVETCNTINDNGLRVIEHTVYESELVCIVKRPEVSKNHEMIHDFLRSIY